MYRFLDQNNKFAGKLHTDVLKKFSKTIRDATDNNIDDDMCIEIKLNVYDYDIKLFCRIITCIEKNKSYMLPLLDKYNSGIIELFDYFNVDKIVYDNFFSLCNKEILNEFILDEKIEHIIKDHLFTYLLELPVDKLSDFLVIAKILSPFPVNTDKSLTDIIDDNSYNPSFMPIIIQKLSITRTPSMEENKYLSRYNINLWFLRQILRKFTALLENYNRITYKINMTDEESDLYWWYDNGSILQRDDVMTFYKKYNDKYNIDNIKSSTKYNIIKILPDREYIYAWASTYRYARTIHQTIFLDKYGTFLSILLCDNKLIICENNPVKFGGLTVNFNISVYHNEKIQLHCNKIKCELTIDNGRKNEYLIPLEITEEHYLIIQFFHIC